MSVVPTSRHKPPRPTVVCFVRHGTTATTGKVLPGRARGLHLSDQGRDEATRAGESLAGLSVAAIYSSPLERTRETASAISERVGKPVVVARDLIECDVGRWTGEPLSRLSKLPEWRTVQRWPSGFRFPGGESFLEVEARLAGAVSRICQAHPGEVVVAVSHADCIKTVLASVLGRPARPVPADRGGAMFHQHGRVRLRRAGGALHGLDRPAGGAASFFEEHTVTEDFELANPERVTVGTVGPVGERMFVLQVREGLTLVTLKLEKTQVSALARFLGRMLGELERPGELPPGAELELESFDEPDFVVRSLGVSYDDDADRIILVADEIDRTEAEGEGEELFALADDLEVEPDTGGASG